jgi:hypothetical protein
MPTYTSCPNCGRSIAYEPHEQDNVFECAACNTRFTLTGGRVDDRPASAPTPEPAPSVGVEDEPEPWFYRYLEGFAVVLMVLAAIGTLAQLGLMLYVLGPVWRLGDGCWGLVVLLLGLVCIAVWLLVLVAQIALIRLAVDAGRNVREILRLLRRRL